MYPPEGGYFTLANIEETIKKVPTKYFYKEQKGGSDSPLKSFKDWKDLKSPDYTPDSATSMWFTKECGFTTVPFSAFFDNNPEGNVKDYAGVDFVRFALCKNNAFIDRWGEDMKKRGLCKK
jgi:rubredoxin